MPRRPNIVSRRLLPAPSGFQSTAVALGLTAFCAPFSASQLVGSLTLGRVIAVVFAITLALDLARTRARGFRVDRVTLLAAIALVGLFCWVALSAAAWGANNAGKLGGFAEFALVGTLALGAVSLEPALRRLAILASLGGLTLAAALALLGVGSLNSGTVDLTQTGGRLSGTYGNANELGFALALGLPIAFAFLPFARRNGRIALGFGIALIGTALLLTYSRGAIIAAAVGALAVALWLARGDRRRLILIAGVAVAAIVLAVALYSAFERGREKASFAAVPAALRPLDQRDLSGWESRAVGPIPRGHALLSNRPEGVAVESDRPGQGASYRWGEAAVQGSYTLSFRARAGSGFLPFAYAIGDGGRPEKGEAARGRLGPSWRRFRLVWRPSSRAPHARLFVWQRSGASTFLLSDVEVAAAVTGRPAKVLRAPARLKGSIYEHLVTAAAREEDRYVRSRLDAARLAVRAFGSSPLSGIGWSTFPAYADEHLDYGQLAAHDEYLAFAAELGLIGLALLGLLIGAAVLGARRAGEGPADTAAIGALAAAAAGLVFVEALPIPQLSIPIAIAIAVICGTRRAAPPRPERGDPRPSVADLR